MGVPWDYVYMETRALNLACIGKYRSVVVPASHEGLTRWGFATEYFDYMSLVRPWHPEVYYTPFRSCEFSASCLGTFDRLQDKSIILHAGGFLSGDGGQSCSESGSIVKRFVCVTLHVAEYYTF